MQDKSFLSNERPKSKLNLALLQVSFNVRPTNFPKEENYNCISTDTWKDISAWKSQKNTCGFHKTVFSSFIVVSLFLLFLQKHMIFRSNLASTFVRTKTWFLLNMVWMLLSVVMLTIYVKQRSLWSRFRCVNVHRRKSRLEQRENWCSSLSVSTTNPRGMALPCSYTWGKSCFASWR